MHARLLSCSLGGEGRGVPGAEGLWPLGVLGFLGSHLLDLLPPLHIMILQGLVPGHHSRVADRLHLPTSTITTPEPCTCPPAHFLSVYFFSIDPQKFIDGSTSSPGCSVINENPGLFNFWADPVKPWITNKGPKAAIWSRGKRNNLAVNFICLAQSRNRERRPLPSFATPFSWQCRKLGSRNVPQRTRPKANS